MWYRACWLMTSLMLTDALAVPFTPVGRFTDVRVFSAYPLNNYLGLTVAYFPFPDQPATKITTQMSATQAKLVETVAASQGLDPKLVHAVIAAESAGDATAVSPKGAVGLMQLMPATAKRFNVQDRYDPRENLKGGVAYLAWLLRFFKGSLPHALAGYHCGEGCVVRRGLVGAPSQTRHYVRRILAALGE